MLLEEGRRRGADLLVLATHGRSGLGRCRYGSVADAVLRRADRPLLLVPAARDRNWPRERPPRLLITLDGSGFAREALPPAGTMAQLSGGEVILLRVVEPPDSSPFTPPGEGQVLGAAAEVAAAEACLEGIAPTQRPADRPLLLVRPAGRGGERPRSRTGGPSVAGGLLGDEDSAVLIADALEAHHRRRAPARPAAEPPAAGGRAITTRGGRRAPAAV